MFHDSFIYDPESWNDLFYDDLDKVVMDHHYYWAFGDGMSKLADFCAATYAETLKADKIKYQVWFGEWALATDKCAHWLQGFNDGTTNPLFKCAQLECPKTYLPDGVDFDRSAAILGPFGDSPSVNNSIQYGKCFTDSLHMNQKEVGDLAKCATGYFEQHLNGTFLWTAHNEIEAKWDYIKAWDMGWLNTTEVPASQYRKYPDFTPYINDTKPTSAKPDAELEFMQD